MSKQDYYQTLGVTKSSTDDQIKKAFRKLAMKYHPDRSSGLSDAEKKAAEEKFKEIQAAYAILSDPQKKQMYDQFGHAGVEGSAGGGGPGGFGGFSGANSGAGFEDIFGAFGDIFGAGRRGGAGAGSATGAMRGRDLECQIEISLEESAFGCEKSVSFPRTEKCGVCHGSGAKKGSDVVTCKTCNGRGQVRFSQGFFSIQQDCPDCRGEGKVIKDPCSNCRGSGLVRENKKIKVNVPAGVEDGSTLRITGEGEAGLNGGPNGDLYVHIRVKLHKTFTRKGKDLHCEVPISFITAALGGVVNVPTLDGKTVKLKVPEGTQTNTQLRVKDKGVKSLRGIGTGDLYCHMFVETPVKLTEDQKAVLRQFGESSGGEHSAVHHPQSKSFVDKLKNLFNAD